MGSPPPNRARRPAPLPHELNEPPTPVDTRLPEDLAEPPTPVDTRLPDDDAEASRTEATAIPSFAEPPRPVGVPLQAGGAARMGFPWGLVAVLGLYVVAVVGYLAWAHWTSPEYQSAQHEAFANELLGPTDGREVEPRFLFEAYGELAEAARLLPHERALHERMEGLHRLMELRRLKLPSELAVRGQAVGMLYAQHLEREQDYVRSLARGVRLTPEQILATPKKVALWATILGLLLAVVGAYLHVTGKSARFMDREKWQAEREAKVEELGEFRRGLPGAPQGSSGADVAPTQRKVRPAADSRTEAKRDRPR